MRLKGIFQVLAVALVGLGSLAPDVRAEDVRAEATFIQSIADRAIEVLQDERISLEEREDRFRKILNASFALDKIGQFVAGNSWSQMSDAQKAEYQELYGEYTLKTYSARLGGYSGQKFELVKTVDTGKQDVFVRTMITQPDGSAPIQCDWRVRKDGDNFKIVDIMVEGISMLVSTKSEFASLVRSQGVEGLIEMLRSRTTKFPAVSG